MAWYECASRWSHSQILLLWLLSGPSYRSNMRFLSAKRNLYDHGYAASEAAEQTRIIVKLVGSYVMNFSVKASSCGLPCARSVDDPLGSLELASHLDGHEVAHGSAK